MKTLFSFLLILSFIFAGCSGNNDKPVGSPQYISSIKKWHEKRVENLKKDNGWLNLAGLYWLKDGINKIGGADDNDIIFPKDISPAHIGTILLQNDTVTIFTASHETTTLLNGKPVDKIRLYSDMTDNPTVLSNGRLRWFVIQRENKMGIRLRDLDAPLVKNFKGINTFPINENWKLTADFKPYNPPKVIEIPSIIGTTEQDTVFGSLVFNVDGKAYSLDPVEEGNEFFIIFADETSGEETYGAGRFLYAEKPDSNGKVILDFNKAYNPPCAFTPFATCPLPPKENYLHLKITAGEKKYGYH